MDTANFCRTCYNYGTNFHSMDMYSINCPQKTFADMLLYIAKIDLTDQNDKTPPRLICDDCKSQLENSFLFVQKAQNTNKRFMLNSKFPKQNPLQCREDCLTESLIDFPLQNDWQIKIEKDLDDNMEDLNAIFNDINIPAGLEFKATEEEGVTEKSISDKVDTDPITVQMDISSNAVSSNTISRIKSKSKTKSTKTQQNERFSCDVCHKTFAWKKDVQRHALTHTSSPKYKCNHCDRRFLRKDKLKDHMKVHEKQLLQKPPGTPKLSQWWAFAKRLYTKNPIFQMQCKLCNSDFKQGHKLRLHLLEHKNLISLDALEPNSDVMQWFKNKSDLMDVVKDMICEDIKEQKLNRYYSIVNENGYEMELSDTDVDDVHSNDIIKSNKYTCDLCQENFSRKFLVIEHVKQMHMLDTLPYKCTVCKLQFVCNKFYQDHLRAQCQSKDKLYQCPDCFGKFMWLDNLNQHVCLNNAKKQKAKPKQPQQQPEQQQPNSLRNIECSLCESKFNKLAELRVHLREHASAQIPLQLIHSEYYKMYSEEFMQQPEDSVIDYIQKELLKKSNMWRFFNATDEFGNEMDINDSDSDENNAYVCSICPVQTVHSQRKYLLQHQKSEHVSSNSEPLPFKCNVCQEQFIAASLLERHKVRDCQKQITKRFSCELCSSSFIWNKNLELHEKFVCKTNVTQKKTKKFQENKRKLQCDQCEKIFIWPKDLIRHSRIHLPDHKKLQCPHCDRKFNRTDNLRRHLRVHVDKTTIAAEDSSALSTVNKDQTKSNKTEIKFECLECCRTFMLQRDLSRHSVMHTREAAIHKCLWCGRKFYNKVNLLVHIERHGISSEQWEEARFVVNSNNQPHGSKQLQCKLCNVQDFVSISALRIHMEYEMLTHDTKNIDICTNYSIINSMGCELDINDSETDEECEINTNSFVYICEICGINCRRKYEVMQHQLTLHKWENLPYSCERCIFRTVCKEILAHHMRTQCFNNEKQYICDICNYRFMWPDNLEQHKSKVHVKPLENVPEEKTAELESTALEPSAPEEKCFQCTACKEKFSKKKTLSAHILRKHSTKPKTLERDAAKFLCAFCGRALSSSSNLIIHMRRHTGEKPFKCKFCDKAFPRSSDMVCHQRTHTGERPHKCTVCHKAFSRMYKLRTHMRIHSGERPYKCTFCEKSFTQSNDLALHIRRHTGERPYVCGICGEGFIQSTALKNHRNLKSHFEDNVPRRGNYLEKIDSNSFCNY